MTSFYHIRITVNKQKSLPGAEQTANTCTPSSLFDTLPKHIPTPISKRRDTLPGTRWKDYRYGPIAVDWIDINIMDGSSSGASKGKNLPDEWRTPRPRSFC